MLAVKDMCRPCYAECITCEDASDHCPLCRHYKEDKKCVSKCSSDHYLDPLSNVSCLPCHAECRSCYGPTEYDCDHCKHYRVYVNHYNSSDQTLSNMTGGSDELVSFLTIHLIKLLYIVETVLNVGYLYLRF
jgi:hypothetical protein